MGLILKNLLIVAVFLTISACSLLNFQKEGSQVRLEAICAYEKKLEINTKTFNECVNQKQFVHRYFIQSATVLASLATPSSTVPAP